MKFSSTTLVMVLVLCCAIEQIAGDLTRQQIKQVAGWDDDEHYKTALQNILVPRVVSSQGWKDAQNFIIQDMESMGMEIETDSFKDTTPIFGQMTFVNIIGRLNPRADRFLTLSCHYDSKYFPGQKFDAATDSAVPCALLLNIVKTSLATIKKILEGKNLGLMLIFFDGEEAFYQWTDNDSLYGSRHLAEKWEKQPYKNEREIDRISVLVLLDLIGATNARFVCNFAETCGLNKRLRDIENSLKSSKALQQVPNGPSNIFLNAYRPSGVSDDHLPFLNRNIPILHLIPTAFPAVWHTLKDNEENLDQKSILNFNKVMRVFVLEYLNNCANDTTVLGCQFK